MRARQPGPSRDDAGDARAAARRRLDPALIRHLAAGFEIERRVARAPRILFAPSAATSTCCRSVVEQRHHRHALQRRSSRSRRRCRRLPRARRAPRRTRSVNVLAASAVEGALRAGLLALALHRPRRTLGVEAQPLRARQVLDEVARQPVGVVQLERLRRRRRPRSPRAACSSTSSSRGQTFGQHRAEALFFARDDLHDRVAVRAFSSGIGVAHLAHDARRRACAGTARSAELAAVPHRPPHDLAQHVAAPFVRRHHAVGDQEGRRADVIGDDAHRHVGGSIVPPY